jgi:hypothetical protein
VHTFHAVNGERVGIEPDAMSLDTTEVPQHVQDRIATREIGVGAVGAPDGPRSRRFAQHVQARGVVDLPVDQHDRHDRAVPRRPRRLQHRVRVQLGEDVRGGVD